MSSPEFTELASKWPSTIVSRDQIENFSGGLMNPRTLANLDCLGKGPRGRFRLGRKVAYPVSSVIEWLEERTSEVQPSDPGS